MARFFLGCPVKKVRGTEAVGITGRIVSLTASGTAKNNDYTAQVVLDRSITITVLVGSGHVRAGATVDILLEQWEPIVPDGMKPVEESELLCLPDGSFNEAGTLVPFEEPSPIKEEAVI